ncbi:MAG: long-chain-fatty-acid--CoA ligase [Desulfarculus sp.]|nr:MAG: long-chain-fatty-acid--CoA ligase [Desulfarculus sp.]
MLVHQILAYAAGRRPDKPALIEGGQSLTYAQTLARAQALAAALAERGVGPGDRVALLFPNCIEFCLAYFAVLMLGAVVVPLNNRLAPKEYTYILNDCGARTLILGYQFWEAYQAFAGGLERRMRLIYAGEEAKPGAEDFAALSRPGPRPSAQPALTSDSPACIMYTSGTTGLPKGAVMSHQNVFINARNCGAHLGYKESDVTLIVVPLFHVTGLNSQLVAFFYTGGACAIMRAYNTAEMIRQMERYRVTVTFKVPTMYTLMLVNEALEQCDLSELRLAAYGGAPMDPETIASLQKRLGVELYNCYGLTETSSLTTVLPACDALRKPGAVGLAVSGVRLRVVDDQGRDLGPDQVGELWIKGPNVVASYWNKPEATAQNLAGGWLRTGDYARIDDEGFVYIADRKKDMINRGGENIYSIEVEAAIVSHPGALEAAVVPRPHSIFGEVVHAFVVPAPGAEVTEEEIIAHCRGLIADYKIPASVSFVKELPRNPGGKVLKTRLREMVPAGDPPRR